MKNKQDQNRKRRKRWILAVLLAAAAAAAIIVVAKTVPFGKYDLSPQEGTKLLENNVFDYDLPLDITSPWPKFRANTLQNGRTPVQPAADETAQPWEYRTVKGIFSSPVVDAKGNTYIGSADKNFYAIDRSGNVLWRVATGEIIDSSALLDDKGRVYFGSGDAFVYCCDKITGEVLWKFEAAAADQVSSEYGIDVYNVNWFEGNIGIMPDGSLLAPNDNYLLYRLNRDTGQAQQRYLANEMIWSLPSQNPKTGNLFFGTTYSVFNNVLSYDAKTGKQRWKAGGIGATAATTLLTSYNEKAGVIVGSYDGTLRCLAQDSGKTLWKRALRDHIYASPAQLSDGTIIQPCADGSVYAIDPANGNLVWAFDTLEPIRSSPAVDANDQIYFGSGEGKLFCLNSDGTLRWAYQCILEGRNDLNGSPALSFDGVHIAGESGEIFFVPYDFPLRKDQADNNRCFGGKDYAMPDDGGSLIYTTALGGLMLDYPSEIEANQALTFTLVTRSAGQTIIGQIDPKTLRVDIPGNTGYITHISADKRFMILIPQEHWVPDENGHLPITINGEYKVNPSRIGMLFFGGKKGGNFSEPFSFTVAQHKDAASGFVNPWSGESTSSTRIELRRQSIPNPCMLPSLNQIGFDSLHYLAGAVNEIDGKTLFWVVGGSKQDDGDVQPDPASQVRFPLVMDYRSGLATFTNYAGFKINFVGSWEMPIASYRIAAAFNPETRRFGAMPTYNVTANCDEIEFYGPGLKLMGMSELKGGRMYTSGSLELEELEPEESVECGSAQLRFEDGKLLADIKNCPLQADKSVLSLLVTDDAGMPLSLPYTYGTTVQTDDNGRVTGVALELGKKPPLTEGETYTVYLMAGTYPVSMQAIAYH